MSPDCSTRVGLVLTLQKGMFALVLSSVFNDPRAGGGVVLPEFKAPCVTCSKFLILSKPELILSEELNELCVSVCVRYIYTCVFLLHIHTHTHISHLRKCFVNSKHSTDSCCHGSRTRSL